ncbi:hypothetical protein AGABI2DRAFT_201869 [Agaricus bisporus var. bisporus H97]|uniref:hypothetical protein n=1 Tax=Agaricus bisporus var. bisporus (strain H97 / ATCC MYA-4626 / FGSC 10389) TaxID=936046 RepID=UPI00029F5AB7|nr:hypothetical protein AGABI2DRAFT_201869 [Agaricus bisporus var. bisporus H97]EKV49451.1 hypothetical protein AGABI2DRAFT_201869 [Agaricus bisporus var. bisporus H97]
MPRPVLKPILPSIFLAQRSLRPKLPLSRSLFFTLAVHKPRTTTPHSLPATYAHFHSTQRIQSPAPLIPIFAVILKTAGALELARTAVRIVLSFVPCIVFKNRWSHKIVLGGKSRHGQPLSAEARERVLKSIRQRGTFLRIILLVPFALFWGTIIASLERTPLTGRWRMIILSPEEENEIAAQLAGPGWYRAVGAILADEGVTSYVPPSDWRYIWVSQTLRKLENTVPVLASEAVHVPDWFEDNADRDGKPMPPPAEFPLLPRSRAAEYLKTWCEEITEQKSVPPVPHSIPGPPYSLVVVENPDVKNAFSYGFGGDGGGGVVVYSGFLDDILKKYPQQTQTPTQPTSWWSRLVGGLFSSNHTPPHPTPTPEQTTELAVLLAHELSHLILAHHLETYSSGTVIVPGILSILSDIVRVAVFPLTMLLGPFVNDAVAQIGKVGSGELSKMGEYCMSMKQEVEADVVSASRLLAYAGFDAREAINFWESLKGEPNCSGLRKGKSDDPLYKFATLAHSITGETHPEIEVRIDNLKKELRRWEEAKLVARTNLLTLPETKSPSNGK